MRNWIDIIAEAEEPWIKAKGPIEEYDLITALYVWMTSYSKDDSWTGRKNDLCRKIIALSAGHPPTYSGILYRGTGIPDEAAYALARGETVTILPTPQLLTSWTSRYEHAALFCENACDDNMSAAIIAIPSSRLKMVVDMSILYDAVPETGHESEILVRSGPLTISPKDLQELWVYREDKEECDQII